MGDRNILKRKLCVNCNICVNNMRRYPALTLDPRVSGLLCTWVYPLIITEGDYICEECRDLAMSAVDQCLESDVSGSDSQRAGLSLKGHSHVCLLCGCSLLRRQRDKILRDTRTDFQRSIVAVIENKLAPRQITESDYVCHACWLRTQREVRRMGTVAAARLNNMHQTPETIMDEVRQSEESTNGNEIIVFCPKCNTEVSHTAEGIQQDQTKILIAKVYRYFEQEYEELKTIYGDMDLTHLSKVCERTALATGVSEAMLMQILKEEERRNEERQRKEERIERAARKRRREIKYSSSEEDSSDDDVDIIEQPSPPEETLVVKREPPEYNIFDEPEIFVPALKVEPSDGDTNKEQTDPIALDLKPEQQDDDDELNSDAPLAKIPRLCDVTSLQQQTQAECSTSAASRSKRRETEDDAVMAAPPVEGCVELNPAEPTDVAAPISEVLHSPVDEARPGVLKQGTDDGAEIVAASSSSHTSGALQIGEHLGGVTFTDEGLQLSEFSNSDDDLNVDDNDCLLLSVQERDAAAEPACVSDLSSFQARVLRKADAANDRAVRDIVPEVCYAFSWTKDRETFIGRRETFTGTSGPTFAVTDQTQAIDIFDKIFDVDFIDLLCIETNRNAEQKIALRRKQNKLAPHSRFTRWTPTNRDEMVSFLTTIILQSLYPLPEEEAYFKFNGFGTMPYFSRIMSYNRFMLLKTFLNFVDDQTVKDTSRLRKIRPVIDHFNAKFSSLYMPSQEIVFDESRTIKRGRLNFARKISSKAAQVGVKTYELCESSSGYLWKFFVYAGKDKPSLTTDCADGRNDRPVEDEPIDRFAEDETPDNDGTVVGSSDRHITGENGARSTRATAIILYDLIEPLLHRGHTVIMDNFHNSPLLLRSLKKQKTDCYGTLRLNREHVPKFVKTLTRTDLQQGELMAAYCSDLSILVWRDANIVSMISTYHNLEIETKGKYNRLIYKPNIVLDYNKSMRGVDRKDQFLSTQPMERLRNKVWYTKLFCQLYNAAIFNCFVIFSSFHRKLSHRQFRVVLAEELLKRHRQIDLTTETRRLTVRTDLFGQVNTRRRVTRHKKDRPTVDANHFPIRTGSRGTVCRMCPKTRRTIWKCEECDVNLCVEGCFKAYHKS